MIARRAALAGLATAPLAAVPAVAANADEIRALYLRFADAQNARDLDRVRATLLDEPSFLWVSDGKSFWGRETMLARMAGYQRAKIWQVKPDLAAARVVSLGVDAAYLHLTLDLTIGVTDQTAGTTRFLVTMLCRKIDAGLRIAALLTTVDNPPG